MADLTFDAVAKVLGVLGTAIKDEAALQGGLPGNMQFIKDELDSMNGFLLHLTKTESEHNDQIRAWMKQVREVAYFAEDCVKSYVRDVVPHEQPPGFCCAALPYAAEIKFLLNCGCSLDKLRLRHRLANQILELKARVNDVGERRQRYGVNVPVGSDLTLAAQKKAEDAADEERRREEFRRLLRRRTSSTRLARLTAAARQLLPAAAVGVAVPPFISEAIAKLPAHVRSQGATVVRGTWKACRPSSTLEEEEDDDDDETQQLIRPIIEMLLCSLYACTYELDKNLEFKRLTRKLEEGAAGAEDIKRQAMVLCYSLLTTSQKSCLQYLTAFMEETAISRTSLVRRWVAEGLVNKEQGRTPQEVGERHFSELVFRGFIHPARIGDAGTVKSCKPLAGSIRGFISYIAACENFVDAELPVHLDRQLKIRSIVRQPPTTTQPQADRRRRCRSSCWTSDADSSAGEPVDKLVTFLKGLPEMYRLNVLDLGGCRGLKKRHMAVICSVTSLKYLCLRKTDISCLDPKLLKGLTELETLDIRQTNIPPADVKEMELEKLKHLLAGSYLTKSGADAGTARASDEVERLVAVDMPVKIGTVMKQIETLSHVQVSSNDGKELARVARLEQLRKLGVVVHGNDRTAAQLRDVIHALAGCLRSLSVWVTKEGGALDISILKETTSGLILENLDIKGRCGLPSWIESATKLANVSLSDTELGGGETLRRLGHIPSLRCLKLGRRSFVGQVLNFKEVQFEALRFLIVDGDTTSRVAFENGAAPKLEQIVCNIGSRVHGGAELIVGIQYLPKLEVIELRGNNFNLTRLMDLKKHGAIAANPRYQCRYLDSLGEKLFVKVPKTANDTTFSLPVGVLISQQNVV